MTRPEETKKPKSLAVRIVRALVALFFWLYVPLKVFVFDVDRYLVVHYFPQFSWILDFRIVIYVCLLLVLLLLFKPKNILGIMAYAVFFPLIIAFKSVVNLVKRNPEAFIKAVLNNFLGIAIYFSHTLINLRDFLKIKLAFFVLFVIGAGLTLGSHNRAVLGISCVLIMLNLLIHYFTKIYSVLMSANIFSVINKHLSRRKIPLISSDKITDEKVLNKLETLVFGYYCLGFIKAKLMEFMSSSKLILFYLMSLFYTILLTIVSLGLMHNALYNISQYQYSARYHPSLFDFVVYSANSVISMNSGTISANARIAEYLTTFGAFSGWILTIIYISLLFSVLLKRYNYTMSRLIGSLDKETDSIQQQVQLVFKMDFESATKSICENNKGLSPIIERIKNYLNDGSDTQ